MNTTRLHEDFCVGPQIRPEHLDLVVEAGFRAVICNRPDGEEPGQPQFDLIAAAARAAGIEAVYLPVSGGVSPTLAADFAAALDRLPKPVFAYCRSGARSAALWQMVGRR